AVKASTRATSITATTRPAGVRGGDGAPSGPDVTQSGQRRPARPRGSRVLARDDPERPRRPRAHVLPAVRHAAVEVGRISRLQEMPRAVVLEGHLAVENVHELH